MAVKSMNTGDYSSKLGKEMQYAGQYKEPHEGLEQHHARTHTLLTQSWKYECKSVQRGVNGVRQRAATWSRKSVISGD